MWRVELCPACQGSCTGYIFYHIQAGYKAIKSGELRMFFGYFTEEVKAFGMLPGICDVHTGTSSWLTVGHVLV